jgi:multidrug resistance efflux pump
MTEKNETSTQDPTGQQAAKDPVRKWTFIILGACIVLMVLYLVADRVTPFTTQARVHTYVVPVAPQISGKVTSVDVANNQLVKEGQQLFSIDPSNYQLAVEAADASLQTALQSVDAGTASLDAAQANVDSARSNMVRAEQDAQRMRRIKQEDSGAISDRRVQSAEASLGTAVARLAAAQASLEAARRQLGATDETNAQIQQARSALEQAKIDLERTTVAAPSDGLVTDLRVDLGNFASAGAPLMTFIAIRDIWIQADFTENNLGNVDAGDPVELVFDVQPGTVFRGSVRATGFGVQVGSNALGTLPTIDNQREWLRDALRFPVVIDFDYPGDQLGLRVGSQVSVIIYSGDNWLMNVLGRLYIRLHAVLSYAY